MLFKVKPQSLKYLRMKYLVNRNSLFSLISVLLIAFLSVSVADKTQTLDLSTMLKISVILIIFFLYFIFNEISIISLLVPFSFSYLKPANYLFYFFISLLFLTFIIIRIWKNNYKLSLPYFFLFLIIFFLGIIAALKATVPSEGIHNFFTVILVPIIIVTVIYNSSFSFESVIKYFKHLVYVAAIVGLIGIALAIMNPSERIGSTWVTAMTINAFYIFTFFISLGLAFREKEKFNRNIFFISSILILFGMLFTYTRIALLSVAFGGFLLATRLKEIRKYAIILVLIIIMFIPSSMVDRAGRNIYEDPSVIIRLFAWDHAFQLFKQNPIFGIGFDTWKNSYKAFVPVSWLYAEHPHNVFIKLLLELGIIGVISYFTIIFNIIWRYYKRIKESINFDFHLSIIIATLSVIFSCLTDVFIVKIPITVFFWISLAFMLKIADSKSIKDI